MSELEGCYPGLMGMSSDMLAVSSCVTPHGFGICGQANVTPTPVPLPTGDTPGSVLRTSVNRSVLFSPRSFCAVSSVTLSTLIESYHRHGI